MAGCAEKVDLKLEINSMSRAHLRDDRPLLFPLPQRICVQDFAHVKYHHVCHAQCFFRTFFCFNFKMCIVLKLKGVRSCFGVPKFQLQVHPV